MSDEGKQMNKKKKAVLCMALVLLGAAVLSGVLAVRSHTTKETEGTKVGKLTVCHLENPMGIDEKQPIFGWQLQSERTGAAQEAYRLVVAESKEELSEGSYLWDSGKVNSGISTGLIYEGAELEAEKRYYWKVFLWDEQGRETGSTEEAWFETGLMGNGMSGAKWISAPEVREEEEHTDREYCYTISYSMEVENTSAGFVFGAKEGRYGEMYLLQITNSGEAPYLKLKRMENNQFVAEEKRELADCMPKDGKSFEVQMVVEQEKLTVSVCGIELPSFEIERTLVGSIGYYKSRGTSHAWLDDILVQDFDENLIYSEDFEGEDTIFSPYYVSVQEGRLRVGSGLMLTPGYESPAPLFRKGFEVQKLPIKNARIYMTALGSFSLSLNGEAVSKEYFAPGKLAYNRELAYVTYDVTGLLKEGEPNALGITLLHGWYDRGVGYTGIWNPWGDTNALLGKLVIEYEDGSRDIIVTDESFRCCLSGPVREDDLYQGEYYDANYEKTGFDEPGYEEEDWLTVKTDAVKEEYQSLPLFGKANEPVVCVQELSPVSVSEPEENVYVYDFGQNFAGTCRIRVKGEKGQVLTLRYAEELNRAGMENKDDSEGKIWTENLLTAEATDYYVLKGEPEGESFEAEFVFHGFRYLQITGLKEAIPITEVQGLVLSSELEQTGSFSCSDELINQYFENTLWSQRSNFMDNPMDCPQRDERHGWAGDAQIFSLTASYNMNTFAFYRKYLRDERAIQNEGGSFADMAPRNFGTEWDGRGGAATNSCWGDAPVVIVYNLYTQYGDASIIRENYEALTKWMEVLVNTSEQYIRSWDTSYGDHLALESTPADLTDTAWCAHSADLLSKMAAVLEKGEDAENYQQLYEQYKKAWQERYVTKEGRTSANTQTSYALGLCFGLFPKELEEQAAAHLNELTGQNGYHIMTGFSGIGYLLPALSENGYTESAYRLLCQREAPSLLYGASVGATTNWEQLQAYREENGTYTIDGSLNHYAYGTPVSWLYTDVLGIKSDENAPGYKHFYLEPHTGGGLSHAEGSYASAYGKISVQWEKTDEGYRYQFVVPANTTATLILPALEEGEYRQEGALRRQEKNGMTLLLEDGEKVKYELSAGTYSIITKK